MLLGIFFAVWANLFLPFEEDCPTQQEFAAIIQSNSHQENEVVSKWNKNDCEGFSDTLSLVYHKLGVKAFRGGKLDSAFWFMGRAVEYRENKYAISPNKNLVQSCYNAGYFAQKGSDNENAIEYFLKCILYGSQINEDLRARSWIGIGQIYQGQGDFYDAKRAYKNALDIGVLTSNKNRFCQATIDYSALLFNLEEFRELVEFVSPSIDSFSLEHNAINYAKINHNLGVALTRTEDYITGIKHLDIALKTYGRLGQNTRVMEMHSNISRAYQLSGDFHKAAFHLDQVYNLLSDDTDVGIRGQYYDHLGELYFQEGRLEEAISQFQKALVIAVPTFKPINNNSFPSELDLLASSDPMRAAIYIKDKAKVHVRNYQNQESVEDLKTAIILYGLGDKAIDIVRSRQSSSATHLWWRSKAIEFYEAALELCALTNDIDRAFYFMEKSRGVLLYEALLSSKILREYDHPIATEYQLVRDSLNLISHDSDHQNVSREQLYLQVQELEDSLKSICKECYDSRFVPIDVNLSKYQSELDSSTVGLYYFSGKSNIYAMMIGRDQALIRSIGSTNKLSSNLSSYLEQIGSKRIMNELEAVNLATTLVGEIENVKDKNLIIYPSGFLFQFPFESLLIKMDNETTSYLGEVCDISYDYSQRLDRIRDVNATNGKIIALAPFIDAKHPNYLSSSKQELEILASQYSGKYLQGADANSSYLKNHLGDYAILHMSTHGYVSDTTAPLIMLSDTLWALNDIYKLRTSANLIILSACETNIGDVSDSEGVLSIGRAFNYAGASSMISSLWRVNSTSTATILSKFYNHVSAGLPKFKALAQAKRDYLQDASIPAYEKAPYYWAGLVYYGDDGGVEITKRKSIWPFLGLVCLLVLGGLFYYKKVWNRG